MTIVDIRYEVTQRHLIDKIATLHKDVVEGTLPSIAKYAKIRCETCLQIRQDPKRKEDENIRRLIVSKNSYMQGFALMTEAVKLGLVAFVYDRTLKTFIQDEMDCKSCKKKDEARANAACSSKFEVAGSRCTSGDSCSPNYASTSGIGSSPEPKRNHCYPMTPNVPDIDRRPTKLSSPQFRRKTRNLEKQTTKNDKSNKEVATNPSSSGAEHPETTSSTNLKEAVVTSLKRKTRAIDEFKEVRKSTQELPTTSADTGTPKRATRSCILETASSSNSGNNHPKRSLTMSLNNGVAKLNPSNERSSLKRKLSAGNEVISTEDKILIEEVRKISPDSGFLERTTPTSSPDGMPSEFGNCPDNKLPQAFKTITTLSTKGTKAKESSSNVGPSLKRKISVDELRPMTVNEKLRQKVLIVSSKVICSEELRRAVNELCSSTSAKNDASDIQIPPPNTTAKLHLTSTAVKTSPSTSGPLLKRKMSMDKKLITLENGKTAQKSKTSTVDLESIEPVSNLTVCQPVSSRIFPDRTDSVMEIINYPAGTTSKFPKVSDTTIKHSTPSSILNGKVTENHEVSKTVIKKSPIKVPTATTDFVCTEPVLTRGTVCKPFSSIISQNRTDSFIGILNYRQKTTPKSPNVSEAGTNSTKRDSTSKRKRPEYQEALKTVYKKLAHELSTATKDLKSTEPVLTSSVFHPVSSRVPTKRCDSVIVIDFPEGTAPKSPAVSEAGKTPSTTESTEKRKLSEKQEVSNKVNERSPQQLLKDTTDQRSSKPDLTSTACQPVFSTVPTERCDSVMVTDFPEETAPKSPAVSEPGKNLSTPELTKKQKLSEKQEVSNKVNERSPQQLLKDTTDQRSSKPDLTSTACQPVFSRVLPTERCDSVMVIDFPEGTTSKFTKVSEIGKYRATSGSSVTQKLTNETTTENIKDQKELSSYSQPSQPETDQNVDAGEIQDVLPSTSNTPEVDTNCMIELDDNGTSERPSMKSNEKVQPSTSQNRNLTSAGSKPNDSSQRSAIIKVERSTRPEVDNDDDIIEVPKEETNEKNEPPSKWRKPAVPLKRWHRRHNSWTKDIRNIKNVATLTNIEIYQTSNRIILENDHPVTVEAATTSSKVTTTEANISSTSTENTEAKDLPPFTSLVVRKNSAPVEAAVTRFKARIRAIDQISKSPRNINTQSILTVGSEDSLSSNSRLQEKDKVTINTATISSDASTSKAGIPLKYHEMRNMDTNHFEPMDNEAEPSNCQIDTNESVVAEPSTNIVAATNTTVKQPSPEVRSSTVDNKDSPILSNLILEKDLVTVETQASQIITEATTMKAGLSSPLKSQEAKSVDTNYSKTVDSEEIPSKNRIQAIYPVMEQTATSKADPPPQEISSTNQEIDNIETNYYEQMDTEAVPTSSQADTSDSVVVDTSTSIFAEEIDQPSKSPELRKIDTNFINTVDTETGPSPANSLSEAITNQADNSLYGIITQEQSIKPLVNIRCPPRLKNYRKHKREMASLMLRKPVIKEADPRDTGSPIVITLDDDEETPLRRLLGEDDPVDPVAAKLHFVGGVQSEIESDEEQIITDDEASVGPWQTLTDELSIRSPTSTTTQNSPEATFEIENPNESTIEAETSHPVEVQTPSTCSTKPTKTISEATNKLKLPDSFDSMLRALLDESDEEASSEDTSIPAAESNGVRRDDPILIESAPVEPIPDPIEHSTETQTAELFRLAMCPSPFVTASNTNPTPVPFEALDLDDVAMEVEVDNYPEDYQTFLNDFEASFEATVNEVIIHPESFSPPSVIQQKNAIKRKAVENGDSYETCRRRRKKTTEPEDIEPTSSTKQQNGEMTNEVMILSRSPSPPTTLEHTTVSKGKEIVQNESVGKRRRRKTRTPEPVQPSTSNEQETGALANGVEPNSNKKSNLQTSTYQNTVPATFAKKVIPIMRKTDLPDQQTIAGQPLRLVPVQIQPSMKFAMVQANPASQRYKIMRVPETLVRGSNLPAKKITSEATSRNVAPASDQPSTSSETVNGATTPPIIYLSDDEDSESETSSLSSTVTKTSEPKKKAPEYIGPFAHPMFKPFDFIETKQDKIMGITAKCKKCGQLIQQWPVEDAKTIMRHKFINHVGTHITLPEYSCNYCPSTTTYSKMSDLKVHHARNHDHLAYPDHMEDAQNWPRCIQLIPECFDLIENVDPSE